MDQVASPNDDGEGVFGPILLRSSTPPPSEKVSLFLRGMAEAPRVSKPISNFGSEFEHMSGAAAWDEMPSARSRRLGLDGPPMQIPEDAIATHNLNNELFNQGDGSEMSYGLGQNAQNGNGNGFGHDDPPREPDEIESIEQEQASTVGRTPAKPKQPIMATPFRNGKVIDSSSSWGNKGPLPTNNGFKPSQFADTPAYAATFPLPPHGETPATPFINIQPPSDPAKSSLHQRSRSQSRAPSESARSKASGKAKSHMSEMIIAGDVGQNINVAGSTNGSENTERPKLVEEPPRSRAPSRAPSRATARPPERSESRAPSRAERALSPSGRTDKSRAHATPTPSKVPLPSSPGGGGSYYLPLHFGPPTQAGSRPNQSRAESVASPPVQSPKAASVKPISITSPRLGSLHPLSRPAQSTKHGESVTSPKSGPKSPTRLHPLTDILRHESEASKPKSSPARSRPTASVRSHRTGMSHELPPITVQLSQAPSEAKLDIKSQRSIVDGEENRTGSRAPSRARSRLQQPSEPELDPEEEDEDEVDEQPTPIAKGKEITEIDLTRTPRTSYTAFTATPSVLAGEVNASHYHDEELCILLHAADNEFTHDVVKKVLRKGVRERVRKLGLDHQKELITARKHHQQGLHRNRVLKAVRDTPEDETPPKWAEGLFQLLREQQMHIERLEDANRVYSRQSDRQIEDGTYHDPEQDQAPTVDNGEGEEYGDQYTQTPHMTIPIDTPHGEHEEFYDEEDVERDDERDDETRSKMGTVTQREYDVDEEHPSEYNGSSKPELYRLKIKEQGDSNGLDKTWHVAETGHTQTALLPEILGSEQGTYPNEDVHHEVQDRGHVGSPPLPPLPLEATSSALQAQPWPSNAWPSQQASSPPSWQRVYQRLLDWALVWSETELQRALTSTLPGVHVDEVALTIWLTQTYKRYVRAKHVEHPPGRVDRLYVPPNIADAINVAVFNGRHGDAKAMLRELWAPFGFEGMPRLLIVLARHRRDANHYVVHRFALPEGSLTTYDTYPEKALADGRPLGWWFAIQAAWPNALYPQPDNLVQKIVRINRPMQLTVDNSVAAAAIWRNLIMGSKAERSVDLVRLRDLINTEVKSLISRKELGRLTVMGGKSQWEEIPP